MINCHKQTNVFNQDGQALHDRILALAPALSSASAHMVWVTLIIAKSFNLDWIVNKVSSNHLDNIKSSSSFGIVIVVQVFQSMVVHILPPDLPGAHSGIFSNPVDWLVIIYNPYTLLTWNISP